MSIQEGSKDREVDQNLVAFENGQHYCKKFINSFSSEATA